MGHAARYELKYLIQEPRAVAVADFVSSYLRPSEHNGSGPIRGHPSSAFTWIRRISSSSARPSPVTKTG